MLRLLLKLWQRDSRRESGNDMAKVNIKLKMVKEAIKILRSGITTFEPEYDVRINGDVIVIEKIVDKEMYKIQLPYVPVVALMLLEKYVEAGSYYSMLIKRIKTGVWE